MRRRHLIALLGGAAALRPLAARAQQPSRKWRIGIIDDTPLWDYFRDRLRELEGQNIAFEYRTADGSPRRLLAAAVELVRLPVDIIAVAGSTAAKAAQEATDTMPIVAVVVGDPVAIGLARNRMRPGGNITGNMTISPDLAFKRLELLRNMLPHVSRVGYFWNPDNASSRRYIEQLRAAARSLGMTLISAEARTAAEFDRVLGALAESGAEAMLTSGDIVQQRNLQAVLDFQTRHRLPGMFTRREDVAAGGLLSYGISVPDLYRRGADAVQKILHGARPAELPFEHPTRLELVVNRRTATALGITIPRPVLAVADEIIE